MTEIHDYLFKLPFLAGLDPVVIADLADAMHVRQLKDGHVFIREGTRGDTLFLLVEGEIAVTRRVGGKAREIHRQGAGEFFGLIALMDDSLRAATCTAVGPVTVASISQETFNRLVDIHPTLGLAGARILGAQLARDYRNIAQQVSDLLIAPPLGENIPAENEYDVIVMGGGPLGLAYATWLKKERPETRIAVVERRVLEVALLETTRRLGIQIFQGTSVNIKKSHLQGPIKEILCQKDGEPMTLYGRVFCDASGPSSVLPRHLGLYRKRPEQYDTFNTNSYFAYFRKKKDGPFERWDLPATRHICFPQGWAWFITLVSWEQTPDENLTAMINYLLDVPERPDESYPSRQELCERFGCQYEVITSVGFTVREDRDTAVDLPVLERFQHYVDRYPAVKWIMDHYELVENPYEKRQSYGAFLKLVHDCEQVAGDGWCVIGDAAQFSNPLFSHGLNYGTGTAYMAMKDTVKALESGDFSQRSFASYQGYARRIFPVLLHQTDMLYRAFNHVDSYERVFALIFFFGAQDALPRTEYSDSDPFVFDLLNPVWLEKVNAVRLVQKRGEEEGISPAEVAKEVDAIVTPFVNSILTLPHVQELEVGTVFSEYTNEGVRQEGREKPPGPFVYFQCPTCHFFADGTLKKCPYCGAPSPLT